MLTLLIATAQLYAAPIVDRDSYGVPHIHAKSYGEAFFDAGYAVAQDRLWQMEMSRRNARGKLAEVLGTSQTASDKEILQTGYTDAELQAQFNRLSPRAQASIKNYCDGINRWIKIAPKDLLPPQFEQLGFKPEPWTPLDSVAICVHLLQLFGRGGAGELRNMTLQGYLNTRKPLANHVLDVIDDIEWFNDPKAIPTLIPADDPQAKSHYVFYDPDRKTTEAHLAMLPKVGLMELLGAISLLSREQSTRVAERMGTPFRTGSYCVTVSPAHSVTGRPLLLSGPQMGLSVPSICHEMSIQCPGLSTVGMDVPGLPGIIIGHTNSFAWGLTSGVADTEDIFFYPSDDGRTYRQGAKVLPLEKKSFTMKIKGLPDVTVDQYRTVDGPVVLNSKGAKAVFAKKSSFWMHEMDSFDAWTRLWTCDSAASIESAMDRTTMNFNFFYATTSGDIGWKYLGWVPKRAEGIDPRFPTPGDPKYAWRGFLTPSQMPHVRNPKSGFLANWNNKPVAWWPNFDTPTWGAIFDNSSLLAAINKPKLTPIDLEDVTEKIAKGDESWLFFKPFIDAALAQGGGLKTLGAYDGRLIDGSQASADYRAFIGALRDVLFLDKTGNFLNPGFFKLVIQPSLILKALEGKTKFDYLAGRTATDVVKEAMSRVVAKPVPPFKAGTFKTLDPTPIVYSNRGTYIQIVMLSKPVPRGVNILPPGVAESGPHANDQSALARAWRYKPMRMSGK